MKHFDHTHETAAEARACDQRRVDTSARLMRAHTSSAILASMGGGDYRPITAAQGQRMDAKYARMNRTARPAPRMVTREARDVPAFAARPAHPKRIEFAAKLIDERDTNMISAAADDVMLNIGAGKAVSADEIALLIDDLLAAPKADTNTAPAPVRPTRQNGPSLRDLAAALEDKGYYALRTPGTADEIHYYRITRSTKGYIKVQEKAGPALHPVDYRRSIEVVRMIADAPQAALNLFADTLEKCYRCSTDLTDPISRAARMGPDCRAK